ncbi:MAG: beta-ketoacyl-ACP synthase II [Candidatus Omnitrophica bacterium]|nr:beta-ketoacyl-ACP synthase II [Candidatus Omnitrophota bacterium]
MCDNNRRVVVTGLGVISPVGNSIQPFWNSLIEGKSGIAEITTLDASEFDSKIAGEIKDFNPQKYGISARDTRRMDKFVRYAIAASKQAIEDTGIDLDKANKDRIGVLIGSGIGSLQVVEREYAAYLKGGPSRVSPFLIPMLIVNEASGWVAMTFGFRGPNSCVATACASGSHAIGDAFKIIERGDADLMVAGGTESSITVMALAGFSSLRALSCRNNQPQKASRPFDRERDGFVMAEGAGIIVLESLEHASKRKADIYAEIAGYGMSCDAYHITAPDPKGEGASLAIEAALRDAQLNPGDIDYINAHGTSTKLNDKIETMAIKKSFGAHAKKVMVSSTKSMVGHLLGAAGGVEFVVSCLTIKNNLVSPTINYEYPDPDCDLDYVPNTARKAEVRAAISNSLGFGGHNATLLVKKFKR